MSANLDLLLGLLLLICVSRIWITIVASVKLRLLGHLLQPALLLRGGLDGLLCGCRHVVTLSLDDISSLEVLKVPKNILVILSNIICEEDLKGGRYV